MVLSEAPEKMPPCRRAARRAFDRGNVPRSDRQASRKHESTVSYWLKKYGLEAARGEKHSAKGAPSREELERFLLLGMSLREMAKEMNRSLTTVRHWMRKYDLKALPIDTEVLKMEGERRP
jgi:transposase